MITIVINGRDKWIEANACTMHTSESQSRGHRIAITPSYGYSIFFGYLPANTGLFVQCWAPTPRHIPFTAAYLHPADASITLWQSDGKSIRINYPIIIARESNNTVNKYRRRWSMSVYMCSAQSSIDTCCYPYLECDQKPVIIHECQSNR